MAHLSERHGEATRRRGDLMRERMQTLSCNTRPPTVLHHSSHSSASSMKKSIAASDQVEGESTEKAGKCNGYSYPRRRTPEELAEFSRQCEQRVANAREKVCHAQQLALAHEQERQARSRAAGEAAPAQAVQRLRKRRVKDRRAAEAELEALVVQQESSLEAMNIARMLSPRFQDRVEFTPAVAKYSAEDERINYLLSSSRVGSFYQ